jgi:hypothetical protein
MKKGIGKYIFAQASGVVVGIVLVYSVILLIKKLRPSLLQFTDSLSMIVFTICALLAFVFIMTLWGRVLVLVGLLTKEEAKGYPYSKPWLEK